MYALPYRFVQCNLEILDEEPSIINCHTLEQVHSIIHLQQMFVEHLVCAYLPVMRIRNLICCLNCQVPLLQKIRPFDGH